MGTDYGDVKKALESGISPEAICSTCPWDRFCVQPPTMSAEDIQAQLADAERRDNEAMALARREGREPNMPLGSLMVSMVVGGKDTQAAICPVLASALRVPDGEQIVRGIKRSMQDNATADVSKRGGR